MSSTDRSLNDAKWTIKSGVPILKLLKSGTVTNNRIAIKMNKAPSTISIHLTRLRKMGLVSKITNEDVIKKLKFEIENRTTRNLFQPYECTASGLSIIKAFDNFDGVERENRITEILISERLEGLDDSIVSRISILINAIRSGICEYEDVTPQFFSLIRLVYELNLKKKYQWALLDPVKQLLNEIIMMPLSCKEIEYGLRFAKEYIIATRFRNNKIIDKTVLFQKIKKTAIENQGTPGFEALNALIEFRDGDGTVSNDLIDAILEVIWVANTPDLSSSIISADAEIDAIKKIGTDLSTSQKMIILKSANYLDALTSEDYVICVKDDKPPSISRIVNTKRKQLLKRYLTIEFSKILTT